MAEKLSNEMLSPVRGARDFSGAQKRLRDQVVELIKRQFENFAFEPLETPAMERLEVLSSKFAGGEEILKEIFKATDQGGRELGLRYDLTVPLCRFIASNTRIAMPYKRYAIGPVWRDGPLKAGRYREFVQCDADIVGCGNIAADAELLQIASQIFSRLFPQNFILKVSNRKIMDGMMDAANVPPEKRMDAVLAIDKLAKIGLSGVETELKDQGLAKESISELKRLLGIGSGDLPNNISRLEILSGLLQSKSGKEGVAEIKELLNYCKKLKLDCVEFDPSLARGLNYYTGSIFEAYVAKGKITSSIAAGGRYDDLIGKFAGAKEKIPAVGISFGLDVICEALLENPIGEIASKRGVFVCIASNDGGQELEAKQNDAIATLRNSNIACAIDLVGRSLGKNLEYASKKGFSFAAIIGEKEAKENKILLKNLKTGREKLVAVKEIISEVLGE